MPQQRVRRVTLIVENSPPKRIDLGKLPKGRAQHIKAKLKPGTKIVDDVELGPEETQEMEDPVL